MERGGGNEKEGTERKRNGRDVGRKVRYGRKGREGRGEEGWVGICPLLAKIPVGTHVFVHHPLVQSWAENLSVQTGL